MTAKGHISKMLHILYGITQDDVVRWLTTISGWISPKETITYMYVEWVKVYDIVWILGLDFKMHVLRQ